MTGAFTTVGCDRGRPLLWAEHRRRLAATLAAVAAAPPSLPDAAELVAHLAGAGLAGPARLRVTAQPTTAGPWSVTLVASAAPAVGPDLAPVALTVVRWPAPPAAGLKLLAREAWDEAGATARAAGFADAIMVDAADTVLEASTANVFARRDRLGVTPPAPAACLPGIMRAWLLEHLARLGLAAVARPLPLVELLAADEVWLTSSVAGIRRVAAVDARTWSAWPEHARLRALFVPAPGWPDLPRRPGSR